PRRRQACGVHTGRARADDGARNGGCARGQREYRLFALACRESGISCCGADDWEAHRIMTHDASLDSTSKLDALLASLSTCHEPTAADARRVRLALEAKLAGPTPEEDEASGVHTKWRGEPRLEPDAGERARAWVGSVGRSRRLLVAAAAIAAVAVATLAHPASFEPQWLAALAGNDDGRADAPHSEQDETLFSGSTALALLNEPPRSASRIVPAALVHDAPCQDWPCLGAEPSVGLSLGGAKVVESGAFEPRPTPEMAGGDRASPPPDIAIPERDDVAGAEGDRK